MGNIFQEVPLSPINLVSSPTSDEQQEKAYLLNNVVKLLHSGFGAEAIQSLDNMKFTGPEIITLKAIGYLFEHQELSVSKDLQDFLDCKEMPEIWKIIFGSNQLENSDELIKKGIISFNEMPPHLRSLVAYMFIYRLKNLGMSDEIQNLHKARDEASYQHLIQLYDNYPNSSMSGRSDLIDPNTTLGRLIDDEQISNEEMLEQLEPRLYTYAKQERRSSSVIDGDIYQASDIQEKTRLRKIKIRLLLEDNSFHDIESYLRTLNLEEIVELGVLIDEVYVALTDQAGDIDFLENSLLIDPKIGKFISDDTKSKMDIRVGLIANGGLY